MDDKWTNQQRMIYITSVIGSIWSILGSLFSIAICIKYRKLNKFCFELIIHLSINTLISGIPGILNPELDHFDLTCKFQALLTIFTDFSTLIWSFLIGYTGLVIMRDTSGFENNIWKYRLIYILIGYTFPLIMCILASYFETLGPAGFWCWLWLDESNKTNKRMCDVLLWIFYSMFWFFTILNLIYIFLITRLVRTNRGREEYQLPYLLYSKNLISYPIIEIIVMIPRTINRFSGNPNSPVDINIRIMFLQTLFDSFQGLLFSFACVMNNVAFRRDFYKNIRSCCKEKEKKQEFITPHLDFINNIETFQIKNEDMNYNDNSKILKCDLSSIQY